MQNALSHFTGQSEPFDMTGAMRQGTADGMAINQAKREKTDGAISVLSRGAAYAMNGKRGGQADPAKWDEFLDGIATTGFDVSPWKGRADLAPALLDASIAASERLKMAQNDRDYDLAVQKYQSDLAAAATPKPTDDMRELAQINAERVAAGTPALSTEEYLAGKKAPLVQISNGGADDEFYKAGAGARGKVFAELEAAGIEAATKIGQVNRLEQLLDAAPSGVEGAFTQIAGEFGIALGEGTDDVQAAQALINTMVPAQRPPGSGPMSDRDVELFKASLPRIINQPGGNELIIQTLKGIAVYEQQVGEIASAVLNKEMTPAEGRKAMAEVENPLELFRNDGSSASDVGNVPDGVDPEVWEFMSEEDRALWN